MDVDVADVDGADLVVLPELCNSRYVFESREEALALVEQVPEGETDVYGELPTR